ncbi:cytochrome c oxidase subunit 3 [Guptibacillus algicola]|uniref:cytochrome c oxidase subunit 3 n=1 Tax=Guptibacillus algicola TaxID=225844 RepID=UPI001CD49D24|nr:cytochrome c oxidase subunit 3 [Alkalihalobacillus algicola]MCA0985897.1 cytochrome c oxidase subunit 3 [Alkalihalobacillus algicola]
MQAPAEEKLFSDKQAQMNILAFWFLIGAEVVVFGCLFGIYVSVQELTANGPGPKELFNLSEIIISTIVLLSSSFTCALGVYTLKLGKKRMTFIWFLLTISLGIGFVFLEVIEFVAYVGEGATISTSAFLGAFYMLLGTHGAHVIFGVVWISMLLIQLVLFGITKDTAPKLFIASLYWHFIDVIWVFIFTVVYLLGKV